MSKLALIRNNLLPPLLPAFHKGQLGKLAVIGGCEDYTGAPYFSAHSAMLSGVDLVHVVCEQAAAPVIKGYSPDLMVHPYMLDSGSMRTRVGEEKGTTEKEVMAAQMEKIIGLVSRVDVLIIGPGIGRNDPQMNEFLLAILDHVLAKAERKDVAVILDADALYHLSVNQQLQGLVQRSGNPNIVLTPNVVEFQRLADAFGVSVDDKDDDRALGELCRMLRCTIIQKGTVDKVCYHGGEVLQCGDRGSLKRVGGQGDSLTGMVGAFLCWGTGAYRRGLYETPDKLTDEQVVSLACLAGCTTTRRAGRLAYEKYGRAMLTSNLHEFISEAFAQLEMATPEAEHK